MEKITTISSRTVVMAASNIDTDQIIPARFLTTTTRLGLGKQLFSDWRYQPDGSPRAEFALNRPEADGCQVLVAGRNFGCGSSREHAPWALLDYGFRAVISTEIADIFRNNSLMNGLLPIVVDESTSTWLVENPGSEVRIDLATTTLRLPDGSAVTFPIDPFAKYCLLNGVDELGFLLQQQDRIAVYEAQHRDN
ncbi:MAG: 3-isopropylmalate dehydratase small subunit [Steroidobacteraceae bacterium]